jgi:hypothetical protein
MEEHSQALRVEPRWPVGLAILVLLFLLEVLPGRIRMSPMWFPYVMAISVLMPMVAVVVTAGNARWLRVELAITLIFFGVAVAVALTAIAKLIGLMVRRSAELSGVQLLTSSIAIWATNVVAFSLLYWQIDRGGPEARLNLGGTKPDWLFPQEVVPESIRPDSRPTYVNYLFLGFSTATAFSTTDVVPLTSRVQILMMLESSISLATLVVILARAINILGNSQTQ